MDELIDSLEIRDKKSLLLLYPIILGISFILFGFIFRVMHWPFNSILNILGLTIIISYSILSFMYSQKTWLKRPLRVLGFFALFYLFYDSFGLFYGKTFYFVSFGICLLFVIVIQITFLEFRREIRKRREVKENIELVNKKK